MMSCSSINVVIVEDNRELAYKFNMDHCEMFYHMIDNGNEYAFDNTFKIRDGNGQISNKNVELSTKLDLYKHGVNVHLTRDEYHIAREHRYIPAYEHYYNYSKIRRFSLLGSINVSLNTYLILCFCTGLIDYNPYAYSTSQVVEYAMKYINRFVINEINAKYVLSLSPTYMNIVIGSQFYNIDKLCDDLELEGIVVYHLYMNGKVDEKFVIRHGDNHCILSCNIPGHKFIVYTDEDVDNLLDMGINMNDIIPNYYGSYNMFHPHYDLPVDQRKPIEDILIRFGDEVYDPKQLEGVTLITN